jgi:hypothetical protein
MIIIIINACQNRYSNFSEIGGKAGSDNENGAGYHLLPYHCLDVAAVAHYWWLHSSSLRRQFTQAMARKDENAENGKYECQGCGGYQRT